MATINFSFHNDLDQNAKLMEHSRKSSVMTSPKSVGASIKMAMRLPLPEQLGQSSVPRKVRCLS